jgi:hypothetical protein
MHDRKKGTVHRITACLRFASLSQMPSALRKHANRCPKLRDK